MRRSKRSVNQSLDLSSFRDIDNTIPDYEFWKDNFKFVNDDIQKRYNVIVYNFADWLPPIFWNGAASLELKEKLVFKKHIDFDVLKAGGYETKTSKSDGNIASNLNTIMNQIPTFQKYKNTGNLDWVVKDHRLLMVELLEYHHSRNHRLATFKTMINTITRIIGLSLTKQHTLYDKFALIIKSVNEWVNLAEGENKLNPNEENRFIAWDYVLLEQKNLKELFDSYENKNTKTAYAVNQDLLLLSLYSLIPPLRAEVKTLQFTKRRQNTGDWIYFMGNDIVLELNEVKKKHDYIRLELPDELKQIIRESYRLYPRVPVFTDKNKFPKVDKKASVKTLDDRLAGIFRKYGVRVGSSILRSSYVTHLEASKQLTYNERLKVAIQMRTSPEQLLLSYKKVFDAVQAIPVVSQDNVALAPVVVTAPAQPVETPVTKAYKNKLEHNKKYYQKNKKDVLKQQKQYRSTLSDYDKSRKKILYFLNNDQNYHTKIRQSTIDKYKITKKGLEWV